jgi:lysophospholipase L1-like esterase
MMMKPFTVFVAFILTCNFSAFAAPAKYINLFKANNKYIQYGGRVDFSVPETPRIWAPGAYILAKFRGNKCEILINDEAGGKNHNYLEIIVDGKNPYRIKLTDKNNVIKLADSLSDTEHTVMICKDTESNIGYIDFLGFRCEQLLPLPQKPARKIEYFGDSITSGTGMDLSEIPCGKGEWYDEHNAYMSYGALASRNLRAQWQLTALAGVGLVHSCCDMNVVMPQIYDKVFLRSDTIAWDFGKYKPDVVTICLGQNDGQQDSTLFCGTYVKFIESIRQHYPNAAIICLSSPMANQGLTAVLKRYLTGITAYMNANGDRKVYKYFFSRQFHNGCGGHPDMADHVGIADELTAYIKQVKGW